ncbi:CoA transferase [Nocardioides sp. Bht2]|uniref:CoA transferase n=1 Tax=Nocardioides sp. Bht2 TaxID=3392297 RepID=UPI0039B3A174
MTSNDVDVLAGWAGSGLAALTGSAAGPPAIGPGDPFGLVADGLAMIADAAQRRTGVAPALPGPRLLTERAAMLGLRRQAPSSAGGAFRVVAVRDGHLGLSLARPSDVELLPALTESAAMAEWVAGQPDLERCWRALADWGAGIGLTEAVERARMLGLPVAAVPASGVVAEPPPAREVTEVGRGEVVERPLVLDFSSLWAGPLCADLLRRIGARVIKVEASNRPDGARRGSAPFFDLLNAGKEMLAVDFASTEGREILAGWVARADLVIEASRPRALAGLGIDADQAAARGTRWLSITAYGRASDAVGFGDDVVAVDAGLLIRDADGVPAPVGDAIADPLTGVRAAAVAAEALTQERTTVQEVSLWSCARAALERAPQAPEHLVRRTDGDWWIEGADTPLRIEDPQPRQGDGVAGALGADTARLLR